MTRATAGGVLAGRRILVTGGAGFIGSSLVEHLVSTTAAESVRVLDNLRNGSRANLAAVAADVELVVGDVCAPDDLRIACRDVDVVFHLACLGVRHSLHAPLENHRVNAEGTLRLLFAARDADVTRFVHVSTSEVFGTAQYAPMDEAHPTWPETVYGGSKLAGEAYVRAAWRTYGFPTVLVRPFNNYGPRSHFEGDSGEIIPRTIVRVLAGLPPLVFGDGTQTRDFLHVSDTARALSALADCDEAVGETVNVGFGAETAIGALVRAVARIAGRPDLEPRHIPSRPGDVWRLWVDNSKVEKLIDFAPRVALETGLAALVEEFRGRPESPAEMLARMSDRNWEAE